MTGVSSFWRKATCTKDHFGFSGEDEGSWYGADGSCAETGFALVVCGQEGEEVARSGECSWTISMIPTIEGTLQLEW